MVRGDDGEILITHNVHGAGGIPLDGRHYRPVETWLDGEALTRMKVDLAKNVPMGRMGDPDEVAKAASFLASDEATYIAGIELYVDGGVAQI